MCCLTLTNIRLKAAVKLPFVILSFLRCVPYSSVNKTCHWRVHKLGGNPTNGGCRTPLEGCPSPWHSHRWGFWGSSLQEASGQGSLGLPAHNNTSAKLLPGSTCPDASGAWQELVQEVRGRFTARCISMHFSWDVQGITQLPLSQGSSWQQTDILMVRSGVVKLWNATCLAQRRCWGSGQGSSKALGFFFDRRVPVSVQSHQNHQCTRDLLSPPTKHSLTWEKKYYQNHLIG